VTVTASGRTTPRTKAADRDWNQRRAAKLERLEAVRSFTSGRVLDAGRIREALEALLRPGDRVALEGDNSISLREHLDVFERGVARRLDFAYAGPQSVRMPVPSAWPTPASPTRPSAPAASERARATRYGAIRATRDRSRLRTDARAIEGGGWDADDQ
jgi:hypothetical protein